MYNLSPYPYIKMKMYFSTVICWRVCEILVKVIVGHTVTLLIECEKHKRCEKKINVKPAFISV